MRDIGPQFTEDGLCRDCTDAGDVGQLDAEDPVEFSPEIERFRLVVTALVRRAADPVPDAQRQDRRGAVQRLDLTLFVDTEHQRAIRRVEVEPDDIAHFVVAHKHRGERTVRLYDKMISVVAQVDDSVAKLAALVRAYNERRARFERQTAWLNLRGWLFALGVILLLLLGGGGAWVLDMFR